MDNIQFADKFGFLMMLVKVYFVAAFAACLFVLLVYAFDVFVVQKREEA